VAASHFASLKDRALAHLLDAGVMESELQKGVQHDFVRDLVKSVAAQTADRIVGQQKIADASAAVFAKKVAAHDKVVNTERERLRLIDDAERKSREEKRQEQLLRDEDQARVLDEQARMAVWEETQPPPPPDPVEVTIKEFDAETSEVVLEDGSRVSVAPEHVELLTELLAQDLSAADPPGQAVLAALTTWPSAEEVAAAAAAAEGEAPAAEDGLAAEGEAPAAAEREAPAADDSAPPGPAAPPASPRPVVRTIADFRVGVPTVKEPTAEEIAAAEAAAAEAPADGEEIAAEAAAEEA